MSVSTKSTKLSTSTATADQESGIPVASAAKGSTRPPLAPRPPFAKECDKRLSMCGYVVVFSGGDFRLKLNHTSPAHEAHCPVCSKMAREFAAKKEAARRADEERRLRQEQQQREAQRVAAEAEKAREAKRVKAERTAANKRLRAEQNKSGVYLLKALVDGKDLYKIGCSSDIGKRFMGQRSSFPVNVELLHSIVSSTYQEAERAIQQRFSDKWVKGEWYRLSPEDAAWICSVTAFKDECLIMRDGVTVPAYEKQS